MLPLPIRVLFVFVQLVGGPLLCVYHIIPTYGTSDRVVFASVGLQLVLVLVLQVLGTWRSLVSFRMKKEAYAEQRAADVINTGVQYVPPNFTPFKWTLPANIIAVLSLFVETIQLAMFSLKALESPPETTAATTTTTTTTTDDSADVSRAQKFANYLFLSLSTFFEANVHLVRPVSSQSSRLKTLTCFFVVCR
jgi:hypothetical protein